MSKSQRTKGANAERELVRALGEYLNLDVRRNLSQVRDSGHDLDGLPVALEVKRQEQLKLGSWWEQAVTQAEEARKPPALAYRQSRQPWRFRLPEWVLSGKAVRSNGLDYTIECGIVLFCEICADIDKQTHVLP